ncbi:RNA-directed DNA polymerase [Arachis hypogaea]|nr:RNA-directed DNA polymerase [Arachis hypogaea]
MGAKGRRFSWHRRVKGGLEVPKKLDKAFINREWRLLFSEAFYEIFSRLHSDHSSIIVKSQLDEANQKSKNHPFRFQAARTTYPLFCEVVHKAWVLALWMFQKVLLLWQRMLRNSIWRFLVIFVLRKGSLKDKLAKFNFC